MSWNPQIRGPGEADDFHDSSLIAVHIAPSLQEIRVVLSTPDQHGVEKMWLLTFSGLLRFEFETLGNGRLSTNTPVEVYSVYEERESAEQTRWVERFIQTGESIH